MTPAEHARNAAISMEVKKDALAQRQSGEWKVSFTIQQIDMHERLTRAPMGTRFMAVLVEIGDDEIPVSPPAEKETVAKPRPSTPATKPEGRGKRDWRDIPPPQQAGIRCVDPIFQAFLKEKHRDDWNEAAGDAAECVRLICAVETRAQLIDGPSRVIWKQLDDAFEAWQALERAS
jgi:hypothetical protein